MKPYPVTMASTARLEEGLVQAVGGMHHVSALTAHLERTHAFYTRVLGLRPVLRTVNQDDPGMYHVFYGDGAGTPGSDITFFDLPRAVPERAGNQCISRTTFRVGGAEALEYWAGRLREHGVVRGGVVEQGGRAVLELADPEGMRLALVAEAAGAATVPWAESPVPAEHQLRGLGYVELTVPDLAPTERFLTEALGLVPAGGYERADHAVHVYRSGPGVAGEVHVAVRPALERARYGAGGVHHVALGVAGSAAELEPWAARLSELGYRHSGLVDRHYFTSLYVREPNHVLFELATEAPGFGVDGPIDGERLALPPFLEPRRSQIEAQLRPFTRAPE